MSGKSYTMREMNSIVEYLVKNKFYGEIRGRKMWMDFANSQLTTRSWQSLKETFLKRILPDIHNPYYGLNTEQINSFRAGYDVADRNKNKLEIHTISDDSNSNENNQKDNEQPKNGNSNEGETTAGENVKCSKINPQRNRSSADTIILDNCYETAEDIQKDLESNGEKEKDVKPFVHSNKSLRDCITYSEPLTPMLQEVLDDFASEPDDSDRESQMEIVDSVPENDNNKENTQNPEPENGPNAKSVATDVAKNAKGLSAEVVEEVLAQELDGNSKPENKSPKKKTQTPTTEMEELPVINLDDEISSMQAETGTEKGDNNSESVEITEIISAENSENPVANDSDKTKAGENEMEITEQSGGLNHSNSTVDASLPNNPEGLKNKNPKNTADKNNEIHVNAEEVSNQSDKTVSPSKKNNRKRSMSVDTIQNMENKKKKFDIKMKLSTKKDSQPTIESPSVKKYENNLELSPKEDNKTIESLEKNDENKLKLSLKKRNKAVGSLPDKEDKKCDNEELKTNEIDEQIKTNGNQCKADDDSHKSPIMIKPQVAKTTNKLSKPSTSYGNDVAHKISTEKSTIRKPAEIINPCLQNVSLYDEQFNKAKYNMSESSDTEQNKKETKVNKPEVTAPKTPDDVVVLKSQSESEVEENHPIKKKMRGGVLTSKTERDKAIANMFGFTSGGVGSKRRRQLSRRRRTISHNNVTHTNMVSNSSEWTSAETDSETFVSPPRGRKNRPTKKYLKPKSAKILSLEEEGGLFVMYGKKIYPLVKDGKIVKNYLSYLPESDSDEGETYWKQKYVEEKKRAEELKKLLELSKEPPRFRESNSPILQAKPSRLSTKSKTSHNQTRESSHDDTSKEICIPDQDNKKEEIKINPPEKIKIKFTKNNEEVHLEGHWPQIHPVLEQVVQIFHKEVESTVGEAKSKMILEPPEHSKEPSSGNSTPIIITPVDPEVHEKVNQIETEIFKEIEERDREEHSKPNEQETHVTKRRAGRPRKSSSSVSHSPAKRPRISVSETKESEDNTSTNKRTSGTENKAADNEDNSPRRLTRKVLNETAHTNDSQIQTRRSKQNLDTSKRNKTNADEEVRYMLPPKSKRQSLKSPANKKTSQRTLRSSEKIPKIFSSPDNISLNSLESTQGYQDSDVSPLKTELRKKKKLDMSSFTIKTRNSLRRSTRRKSHPYVYCDAYNDSSNSSVDASIKKISRENSSLNTEAYRSESYQLLMPQALNSFRPLQPIDETCPVGNESDFARHLQSMSKNEISVQNHNDCNTQSGQITSDVGSSSNVSLPMSPELSVVENMSISKDLLNSIEDYPTLNELQINEVKEQTMCRKYMISDVDVSVPLMQQDCGLESCNGTTDVSNDPKSLVTESLLSKIGTFNINDQVTAIDTLDKKLHDMLLESAKKMTRAESTQNKESMMDVDVTSGGKLEVQKKAKSKKRCSTPRKRKTSQKSVAPKVEPLVEEEQVESHSRTGRKSCPPIFQTFVCENDVNKEMNIANQISVAEKPKAKKKKNIIKVKIQRPQTKPSKKSKDKLGSKSALDESRISVFSDSGINETESGLYLPLNDSVDLIHNHSETCLQANECVGDSIEFVENSKSVITLGDSMQSGDNTWFDQSECYNAENTTPDLFCNNAQDMKSFYKKTNTDNIENSSDTVYHSPLGTDANNSLITEDLSDDPPQPPARLTKWYLLSEDETNNTNMVEQGSTMLAGNAGSFGSSLKQLFPIACAVPDLSTISEQSRENEDSRKPNLDLNGLMGDDFNSQSIFDSNL